MHEISCSNTPQLNGRVERKNTDIFWKYLELLDSNLICQKLSEENAYSQPHQSIRCDNRAIIHICTNPIVHERRKHIEIVNLLIRKKIQQNLIKACYICKNEQPADLFTKGFEKFSNNCCWASLACLISLRSNLGRECWRLLC